MQEFSWWLWLIVTIGYILISGCDNHYDLIFSNYRPIINNDCHNLLTTC